MAIVYRHIRLDKNEPFYIGIAKNMRRPHSKSDRNKYWKHIISKTKYRIEILFDDLTWEEACEKEKEFIKLYGRKDLGLGSLVNMTDGGEGANNVSQESIERTRLFNLGRKMTDETKLKMSLSHTGKKNGFYGKTHNEDTINKIKNKKTGQKASKETKKKMSESQKLRNKLNPYYDNSLISQIKKLLDEGVKPSKIQKTFNIPKTSYYRITESIKKQLI
jgi:hypothetical protein